MPETVIEVAGRQVRAFRAGQGPVVLFFHGAGGLSWTPLLEKLSADFTIIAPEHPGFGRTEIPEWMMSTGDVAFYYLDFMNALGLEDVHLAGHSMGGWIAAEVAIRNTSRLKTLTLLAPAGVAVGDVPFGEIFTWSPEENARAQFFDQALAEARLKAPPPDIDIQLQNKMAVARLAWTPRLHNPQLPYWLHRIDVPTALVWGEEDKVVPFGHHGPWVKEIPDIRLHALPRTGHSLGIESAEGTARLLADFYRGAGR